jgi:hypothetical protein
MIFLQPSWVLAFVFAFVYLGAGRMEERHGDGRNNGILWAGLSIAASATAIRLLGGGSLLVVVSQVLLFGAITAYRAICEP